MPASVWLTARQRDFTGGENLSLLPEKVGRNQFIRMENAIISPQGEVTAPWQMDTQLFINVAYGIVLVPVPSSRLYTVYAGTDDGVVQFIADPQSPTAYDIADASGYPGYVFRSHTAPVSIVGVTHAVPFLGKHYCCATTNLYIDASQLAIDPIAFGTVTTTVTTTTATVTNTSEAAITLYGASFSGADAASFSHSAVFPHTMAPGTTFSLTVTFNASAAATRSATLSIATDAGVRNVSVSGRAVPVLSATPASFGYGLVHLGEHGIAFITIRNTGVATTVRSITFTNNEGGYFAQYGTQIIGQVILTEGERTPIILFTPDVVRAYSTTMTITTDEGAVDVALTGSGV